MIVLKVYGNGEIHRIQLNGTADHQCVCQSVQDLFPSSDIQGIKYVDEEGDQCTLIDATFTDFLQTAQEGAYQRKMLKVHVTCKPSGREGWDSPNVATKERPAGFSESAWSKKFLRLYYFSHGTQKSVWAKLVTDEEEARSNEHAKLLEEEELKKAEQRQIEEEEERRQEKKKEDDLLAEWEFVEWSHLNSVNSDKYEDGMEDIQAEINFSKAACEAVVDKHLGEWLLSNQGALTYEDWIAALHPENVKETLSTGPIIDARMYLERSFHRQLWNTRTAELPRLSAAEKQRCQMPPR